MAIEVLSPSAEEYLPLGLEEEKLCELLKKMLLCRRFEEKIEDLFLVEGLLYGPAHLYLGQEATGVGVIGALKEDDVILSHHRGHCHAIAKDIPLRRIMSELFGKRDGTCKGLSGSMHVAIDAGKGALYSSAIVGSNVPIGVGCAFALKHGENRLATSFFGDGAVTTGAFAEGLNMAAFLKVPLLLVCENNQYAMSFKTSRTISNSIAERALAYGIQTYSVDGNDVLAVYKATRCASDYIKDKKLPAFIEARSYRLKGHGVYDPAEYKPKGEAEEWNEKDPITLYKNRMLNEGIILNSFINELEEQVKAGIEDSIDYAQKSQVLSFEELCNLMGGR